MTKIYIFNSHTPVTLLQLSHDLLEFATTLTHRSADTFDSCKNSILTNALLWQLFYSYNHDHFFADDPTSGLKEADSGFKFVC